MSRLLKLEAVAEAADLRLDVARREVSEAEDAALAANEAVREEKRQQDQRQLRERLAALGDESTPAERRRDHEWDSGFHSESEP